MRRSAPGVVLAGLLVAGCGAEEPAGLEASGIVALAPLPGQDSGVAYLTLTNGGPAPIEITDVTSPDFARVEMHATVIGDGIAEMLKIDALTVAPDSAVEFATGGRHLMLMDPRPALAAGDEITLEFHYGSADPFRVRAPLQPRTASD